jgi:hypothetical protein
MADEAVRGELRERDLGDQLGAIQWAPRTAARGASTGAVSRASGVMRAISASMAGRVEAGPTLPE